jgi:hypothetical protein
MFQGVKADESGLRKLVKVLNARLERGLKETELDAAFDKWWPDLRSCLGAIEPSSVAPPVRDAKDILAEVLALARQQTANSYDALTAIVRIADAQDEITGLLLHSSTSGVLAGIGGLRGLIGGVPPVRGAPLPTAGAYEGALKRALEGFTPSIGEPPPKAPGDTRQAQ